MAEARILVVDDEVAERITLAEVLRLEGFKVSLAASGEEAITLIKDHPPFDVVVLDLRLPGVSGLEVLDVIREVHDATMVILITGFGTLETAIEAMRKGAYDYLLKPTPVDEIIATVRRALSELEKDRHRQELVERLQDTVRQLAEVEGEGLHAHKATEERFLQGGNVMMDHAKHLVTVKGEAVDLTPTEFKLLECLMRRKGKVCTPQELVRCAQGYETDAKGARSIIRVHVRRLRSKIEPEPKRPRYILNVRGVGYMFSANPEEVEE
jgi:two-component system KDP operon response regulator KdpE